MVSGRSAVDTAGRSVFQCAETATIALGRGSSAPSDASKSRAGRFSRISVGDPCDTKTDGIDIASILAQHLKSANGEVVHVGCTHIGGPGNGHMGIDGAGGERPDDAAPGGALRSQGARSDLDDGVHYPKSRLHDLRRAVRQG